MTRFGTSSVISILLSAVATACGGSCPQASDPTSTSTTLPSDGTPTDDATSETKSGTTKEEAPGDDTSNGDNKKKGDDTKAEGGDEPKFGEHATVAQAMAAVPKGTTRSNVDPERLGEPLQNAAVYEPCKIGTQHFKLRVAVWNGQAVGVDVTSTNAKLVTCVEQQVRSIQWPDKVRSLNTVEYSM